MAELQLAVGLCQVAFVGQLPFATGGEGLALGVAGVKETGGAATWRFT